MKMYEVKYVNKEGLLNTVTIEAENSTEARKAVKSGFADCEEVVKSKALDQHRKAVTYSVAIIEPQENDTPRHENSQHDSVWCQRRKQVRKS